MAVFEHTLFPLPLANGDLKGKIQAHKGALELEEIIPRLPLFDPGYSLRMSSLFALNAIWDRVVSLQSSRVQVA